MTKAAPDWMTYHRFSFLSDDVIVFPNTPEFSVELCNISDVSDIPKQDSPGLLVTALALELPEIKTNTLVWDFCCDAEQPLSLFLHGDENEATMSDSPYFQSSFADGLVVFTFSTEYRVDWATEFSDVRFVIHRRALLDLLAASLSSTAETTREAGVDDHPCVLWSEWGPSRTRWFDVHAGSGEYSQLTWGQRVVSIRPKYDERVNSYPISVYNFNPAAVSASVSTNSSAAVNSLDSLVFYDDGDPRHATESLWAFEHTVWSQLPFVKSESSFLFDGISGVMMDGEMILLLRLADSDDVYSGGVAWLTVLCMV